MRKNITVADHSAQNPCRGILSAMAMFQHLRSGGVQNS